MTVTLHSSQCHIRVTVLRYQNYDTLYIMTDHVLRVSVITVMVSLFFSWQVFVSTALK